MFRKNKQNLDNLSPTKAAIKKNYRYRDNKLRPLNSKKVAIDVFLLFVLIANLLAIIEEIFFNYSFIEFLLTIKTDQYIPDFGCLSRIGRSIIRGANMLIAYVLNIYAVLIEKLLCSIEPMTYVVLDNARSFTPAKSIISTIGIGGFALSSINELKAKRSHGIAWNDVISYYYPKHQWFFLLHLGFIISGLYVCEIGHLRAVTRCVLGVLVCFAVSLRITWVTSLRHVDDVSIIHKYIRRVSKQYVTAKKKTDPKSLNMQLDVLISDTALFIGAEYHRNSRKQPKELLSGMKKDINTLLALLSARQNYRTLGLKDKESWKDSFIFSKIFNIDKTGVNSRNFGQYVIFAIPRCNKEDNEITHAGDIFCHEMITAELIWRNVFCSFKDDQLSKSEIAAVILTCAFEYSYGIFITLACGLLAYQRKNAKNTSTEEIEKRVGFLQQMLYSSDYLQLTLCQKYAYEHRDWLPYKKFLSLLEIGVFLWENALYLHCPEDKYIMILSKLLEITNSSSITYTVLADQISMYLAYSYLIYINGILSSVEQPSRSGLEKLFPYIEGKMMSVLQQKEGI